MLLPKFLSRKRLSRKHRSIFASKISPATGVTQVEQMSANFGVNDFWHTNNNYIINTENTTFKGGSRGNGLICHISALRVG